MLEDRKGLKKYTVLPHFLLHDAVELFVQPFALPILYNS